MVNQKYVYTVIFVVLLRVLFSDLCTPSLPLVYYPRSTHTLASSLVLVVLATGTCRKVHIYDSEGCFVMNCCHVSVYKRLGYIETVAVVAEKSMRHAISLVECTEDYERLGEVRNACVDWLYVLFPLVGHNRCEA